jgi:hypothetical protein
MFTPGTAAGPGATLVPHGIEFREFVGTFVPEEIFDGDAFPIQSFVEMITWTDGSPGFVGQAPMLTIGTGRAQLETIRQQALQLDLSGVIPIRAESEREVCWILEAIGVAVAVVGTAVGIIAYKDSQNTRACVGKAGQLRDNCIDGMLNQTNPPDACGYRRGACCYDQFKADERNCPSAPTGGMAAGCLSIVCH